MTRRCLLDTDTLSPHLTAGIARANDMLLVTNNEDHFGRIRGLQIVNWLR